MFAASIALAAAPPTRSEYVAAAEPICKEETLARQGMLRGVEGMVERGDLKPAARRLLRASTALRAVVKRLAQLPRPPADRTRLARWLKHAGNGATLLRKTGVALKRGDRSKAERFVGALLREVKRANATVIGFGFDYCRLNPARFV